MSGYEEKDLVDRLFVNGWIIFTALLITCFILLPPGVAISMAIGGLIVMINLIFLRRAVRGALESGRRVTPLSVLPGFYLCFFLTAFLIFSLISLKVVNCLGLLLGLSVFVLTVFFVVIHLTGRIVYKTLTKEAA